MGNINRQEKSEIIRKVNPLEELGSLQGEEDRAWDRVPPAMTRTPPIRRSSGRSRRQSSRPRPLVGQTACLPEHRLIAGQGGKGLELCRPVVRGHPKDLLDKLYML